MKKKGSQASESPAHVIDAKIDTLGDWRGKMLARGRQSTNRERLWRRTCSSLHCRDAGLIRQFRAIRLSLDQGLDDDRLSDTIHSFTW